MADNGLRFAVHGTAGSWIKHGVNPQEAATLAGRSLEGDDWGHVPQDGTLTIDVAGSKPVSFLNQRGNYRLFWPALVAAIRSGGANPVPPHEALAVMEVLDASIRSAAQHAEVLLSTLRDR